MARKTHSVPGILPSESLGVSPDNQLGDDYIRKPLQETPNAKTHTPVYKMHKYFARRPWNVFSQIVSHYSSPNGIVLDPFCGGGTTVVESLKLRRRTVGVDLNPMATYITAMECRPVDIIQVEEAFWRVSDVVSRRILSLYLTHCKCCGSDATTDFVEWNERSCSMTRLQYRCSKCGLLEKPPDKWDIELADQIARDNSPRLSRRIIFGFLAPKSQLATKLTPS